MTPQVKVRVAIFCTAVGLLQFPAFSQGRGGGGGTSTTTTTTGSGTTGTTGTGTRPTIPNTPTNPTNPQPTYQPPIFLSGRVMLEDGTPPPESVVIERVCNGQPHAEGYTDAKGYFGIELGNRNGVLQDASESGNGFDLNPGIPQTSTATLGSQSSTGMGGMGTMGGMSAETRYNNCELRARLAGYRSQVVSLVNRRSMDNPDIGVILLHRMSVGSEGATVSASTLAAPKDARKAFLRGKDAAKKNRNEDAIKAFQKAVTVYPKFAEAWCELGRMKGHLGLEEDAQKAFEEATKADPKYVPPYMELAMIHLTAGRWQELADVTAQVTKLDAFDYPQAFFLNAIANYNVQNLGAAELSARESLRLDTRRQFPKAAQLLGIILAQRHDYPGAADEFREYLKMNPTAADAAKVREQLDRLEKASAGDMPRVVNRDPK